MKLQTNRRWFMGTMLGVVLIASGCVTINIYFPAAAAEKAADRIIDEVWQLKRGDGSTPTPAPASGAKPDAK